MSNTIVELYFDGASRGNGTDHSMAGAGWHAKVFGNTLLSGSLYLGNKTNNEAEYLALINGLEAVLGTDYTELKVYGDSLLVISQTKGTWKVKAVNLIPLHQTAKKLSSKFKSISFHHIDRSLNYEADALANKSFNDIPTNELV